MDRALQLKKKYENLLAEVREHECGQDVCIVAVSKYSSFSDIEILYSLGQRDFGENRIESLLEKAALAKSAKLTDIKWHFIGNIQSNKIKDICSVEKLVAIHSIDSLKHLKLFHKHVQHPVEFFIQFNTSGESEKSGLNGVQEFAPFREYIKQNDNSKLSLKGLMTMGKIRSENQIEDARVCFSKLVQIRDELDPCLGLSMGMSSDFTIALGLGATDIRVVSNLFL